MSDELTLLHFGKIEPCFGGSKLREYVVIVDSSDLATDSVREQEEAIQSFAEEGYTLLHCVSVDVVGGEEGKLPLGEPLHKREPSM